MMFELLNPNEPNSMKKARQQLAGVMEHQIRSVLEMLLTCQHKDQRDVAEVERQFHEIVNGALARSAGLHARVRQIELTTLYLI